MLTIQQVKNHQNRAIEYFEKAQIKLTEEEKKNMEVADFGLNIVDKIGLQAVVYINTDRCCAKEMVLFPYQICPEHKHPDIAGKLGKEETFRCRWGEVYLYVEGTPSKDIQAKIPEDKKDTFTVFHQIILKPGEQYTLTANTLHWFQAGPGGAIISEFSTHCVDEKDIFTDTEIKRILEIAD